jgi:hypothetical protein
MPIFLFAAALGSGSMIIAFILTISRRVEMTKRVMGNLTTKDSLAILSQGLLVLNGASMLWYIFVLSHDKGNVESNKFFSSLFAMITFAGMLVDIVMFSIFSGYLETIIM